MEWRAKVWFGEALACVDTMFFGDLCADDLVGLLHSRTACNSQLFVSRGLALCIPEEWLQRERLGKIVVKAENF